ncbi:MAG: phospholipid carrier-dependent glycosyltransferase [Planctomycetota bacterium]|jgi:hypothetical protein
MLKKEKHSDLKLYCVIFLFFSSVIIYGLLNYGGIRSSDGEVVFRTAESLATKGTFAVSEELLAWKEFGLPQGKDGRYYSLFGPGQALICVPFVKVANAINETEWYKGKKIPLSYYVKEDLLNYFNRNIYPQNIEPHALRFIISFFNVLVTSITVVLFFLLIEKLTQSVLSAAWVAVLFAFGTFICSYSGTFLSEPLATLFLLWSFRKMLHGEFYETFGKLNFSRKLFLSGLLIGLAVSVHITAILFIPFFFVYVVYSSCKAYEIFSDRVIISFAWLIGLTIPLILLGYYNYERFGNILETGRTADPDVFYSRFVFPLHGLSGLLWSSGKGIIWYSPIFVVGLFRWRYFYENKRFLSIVVLGAILFRFLFIANRSDWHGGFCVGPRYMVMLTPFFLIPLGFYIKELFISRQKGKFLRLTLLFFLCISQQLYFCLGEVSSFFHMTKNYGADKGIDTFENDFIYFNWNACPLFHLLQGRRGPYFLQQIPLSNLTLWLVSVVIIALFVFGMYLFSVKFCNHPKENIY